MKVLNKAQMTNVNGGAAGGKKRPEFKTKK